MYEFRGMRFSQEEIAKLEWAFNAMGLHEAMDLCGTAPRQLTEPRRMNATELSTLSGMLDGLSITPKRAFMEAVEKFVLPGKIISIASFVINPVDAQTPIAIPALEGLKKLRSSCVILTALGPSKEPDNAVSFRGCPLSFRDPSGNVVLPTLTSAGNYKFELAPGVTWTLRYGK
jgi:hypothetical protein